jgi:hypothetical protein
MVIRRWLGDARRVPGVKTHQGSAATFARWLFVGVLTRSNRPGRKASWRRRRAASLQMPQVQVQRSTRASHDATRGTSRSRTRPGWAERFLRDVGTANRDALLLGVTSKGDDLTFHPIGACRRSGFESSPGPIARAMRSSSCDRRTVTGGAMAATSSEHQRAPPPPFRRR